MYDSTQYVHTHVDVVLQVTVPLQTLTRQLSSGYMYFGSGSTGLVIASHEVMLNKLISLLKSSGCHGNSSSGRDVSLPSVPTAVATPPPVYPRRRGPRVALDQEKIQLPLIKG